MVSCDVSKKSRYGVESYDYTIKYRLDDNYVSKKVFTTNNIDHTSNKRRHQDRSNVKLRLGKRVNSNHFAQEKQEPKYLENLTATPEDPADALAIEMASKLNEEKKDLVGMFTFYLSDVRLLYVSFPHMDFYICRCMYFSNAIAVTYLLPIRHHHMIFVDRIKFYILIFYYIQIMLNE